MPNARLNVFSFCLLSTPFFRGGDESGGTLVTLAVSHSVKVISNVSDAKT